MSTIQDHPSAFGSYMPAVPQDEAKLKQFAETVTGSDSLRFFAVAHGYKRSAEEAEQVYVKARAMLHALSGQAPISDEMLDAVNGPHHPCRHRRGDRRCRLADHRGRLFHGLSLHRWYAPSSLPPRPSPA
jgi:hypothetical protein